MIDNDNSTKNLEAIAHQDEQYYSLRLYIAGTTPQSFKALNNIRKICEEYLAGRYDLEVIDVYQQPYLIASENIVVIPTLIKQLPPPLQRLIGNMSNTEKVLVGLDIKKKRTNS